MQKSSRVLFAIALFQILILVASHGDSDAVDEDDDEYQRYFDAFTSDIFVCTLTLMHAPCNRSGPEHNTAVIPIEHVLAVRSFQERISLL